MGGVACLRGDAKIRIVCPVFRRRKTFFDHISRPFKRCMSASIDQNEALKRSASIAYGYTKQFFGILPLDVKIESDTTYYHFNCGPLYIRVVRVPRSQPRDIPVTIVSTYCSLFDSLETGRIARCAAAYLELWLRFFFVYCLLFIAKNRRQAVPIKR